MRFARLRSVAATLTLLAGSAVATTASAQRQTITFSEYRSPTTLGYQADPTTPVTSNGFNFYAAFATGASNLLGTWGTDRAVDPVNAQNLPTNLGNSAALFGALFGDQLDMDAGGNLFSLYSMDVAHMYNSANLTSGSLAPISLYFYGFDADGINTLVSAFTIPAPSNVGGAQFPVLTTLLFSDAWRNLSNVTWFNASGPFMRLTAGAAVGHQFTNVVAEINAPAVVPEPSTVVLLGLGIAGLVAVTRSRYRTGTSGSARIA